MGALNKYWCLFLGDYPCGARWKEKHNGSNDKNKFHPANPNH